MLPRDLCAEYFYIRMRSNRGEIPTRVQRGGSERATVSVVSVTTCTAMRRACSGDSFRAEGREEKESTPLQFSFSPVLSRREQRGYTGDTDFPGK